MSDDKSVTIKDTVENKDYGVIDIHKLGFKLLKENKKKYALLLLQVALVIGLYIVAFLLFIIRYDKTIGSVGKLKVFSKLEPILWFRTSSGTIVALVVLSVLLVILLIAAILWLYGRTIVNVNTNIDVIENKEVSSGKFKTFLRTLVLCLIGASITFLFGVFYIGSAYISNDYYNTNAPMSNFENFMIPILNVIIIIATLIILMILYRYLLFMFFDVMAKYSTIKNALKNVYRNFVYSKNKIIKKVVAGGLLNVVILVAINILFTLLILILMNTPIVRYIYRYSHIVVWFSGIVICVILFLINLFCLQYMYLVYMLNEVDEDKEIKEVKSVN